MKQMHVAVQASLPKEIAPLGATTLLTFVSVSCTIFLGLGQLVFQARLTHNLSSVVPPDVVDRIISAGATNLASVVDKGVLPAVIEKYGESATQVFVSLLPRSPYPPSSLPYPSLQENIC